MQDLCGDLLSEELKARVWFYNKKGKVWVEDDSGFGMKRYFMKVSNYLAFSLENCLWLIKWYLRPFDRKTIV